MSAAHLQAPCNPVQRHDSLASQSRRHLHLECVRFATLLQILLRPSSLFQLFQHQAPRLLLVGLALRLAAMMLPHCATHHLQHLFPHLRPPQNPPPPHRLPLAWLVLASPLFHGNGKTLPPCRVIAPDPQLPHQPIHPHPTRPPSPHFHILPI